jgi:ribosomal protein S18 acetylase RimI-like enzyme
MTVLFALLRLSFMTISIRPIAQNEIEAARQLLLANGWSGARFEPGNFGLCITNAHASLVAIEDDRVVGFARALGDGVFNGYLSMLVVHAEYRRRGIGQRLVRQIMGDNLDMTWVLRAREPHLEAFYNKLGFVRSTVAMERTRIAVPDKSA